MNVQGVSMCFTELFLITFFVLLREFLYMTLIHLVTVVLIHEISVIGLQAESLKITLPVKGYPFIPGILQRKVEVRSEDIPDIPSGT